MKARIVWILAALAMVGASFSAYLLSSHRFLGSDDLAVKPFDKGLANGEAIVVKTRAGRFGVQKGDAFPYIVEVWYDPDQVSEIDRTSLDNNVNLEPFETRGIEEEVFTLDSGTRVVQREYELQLLDGQVEHLYEFPTLVVRYSLEGSEGLLNVLTAPEPVYVAPRLPADITTLDLGSGPGYGPLRPVRGDIEEVGKKRLPWILWTLGGLLATLAVADLGLRVLPSWKETEGHGEKADVLTEAYCSLLRNFKAAAEPKLLFYQMERILRMVLARKENIDWLEPDLDAVSSAIRPSVMSLFEACQEAYRRPETARQDDVAHALGQLEEILRFYFGEGEIAACSS